MRRPKIFSMFLIPIIMLTLSLVFAVVLAASSPAPKTEYAAGSIADCEGQQYP